MLPNFVIIGSQKAGTTTLWSVLREHPEVFMPEQKELNFFFLEAEFAKGIAYYQRFFEPAPVTATAVGEASPGYVCHPLGAARLSEAVPNARLVLTVRDPVRRAYSQYWHNRRRLGESRPFDETLDGALVNRWEPGVLGYFGRGNYIRYIREYLRCFPRDHLHIVVFDDLKADPRRVYRELFEFLDVDPDFEGPAMSRVHNPASIYRNPIFRWFFDRPRAAARLPSRVRSLLARGRQQPFRYPPMSDATKARLSAFFAPWNRELETFLDRRLDWT